MAEKLPSETLLGALLSSTNEAMVGFQLDGSVILWNATAEHLYGYSESEMLGRHMSQILFLDELPAFLELLGDPALSETRVPETASRKNRSGHRVPVQTRRSLIRAKDGKICGILEKATLATTPAEPFHAEAHLRHLASQLPVVSWATDHRLRITSHWGPAFRRRAGARPVAIGRSISDYFNCTQAEQTPIKQHMDALQGISSQFEFRRRNRILEMSLEPFRDPQNSIIGCLGLALDITERKKTEEDVRYQATHDGLTGLANYREFFDSLEREVVRAERTPTSFSLLLIDLDDLKGINDRLGHLAGNVALKRLAGALKEHCRASDLAARFGGDEFAVLLLDSGAAMAEQVAARVKSCLRDQPLHPLLTVSIGAATYPEDASSAQDLFEIADKRLYANKKAARLHVVSQVSETALGRLR